MTDVLAISTFAAAGLLGVISGVLTYTTWRLVSHGHVTDHQHGPADFRDPLALHGGMLKNQGAILDQLTQSVSKHLSEHEAGVGHPHFWVLEGDRYLGPTGKPTQKFRCALSGCSAEATHELE